MYVCLPYSKHVFVPNFADMECGYAEVTPENAHLVESCYEARTEKELPVLIQYIDRNKYPAPKATFLDVILYSRDQIIKENEAMGNPVCSTWSFYPRPLCSNMTAGSSLALQVSDSTAPWGIISVKGQLCDYELPMQPITIMRNALGKEHGGSGVPLDFDKYMESVNFWKKNVALK